MKKKLFGLLALILVIGTTGCGDKGEINYQGVYELGETKIKTYLKDDNIYYNVENDTLDTTGSSEIKENIFKPDSLSEDATITFKNNKISVKTSNEYLESGDYKYTKPYTNEEFYNDFYGDKKYLDSEINGVYIKDDIKIYVYQKNEEAIRIFFELNDATSDFEINLDEEGNYYLAFFETVFNITFEDNTMIINIEAEDDQYQVVDGTYEKASDLKLDDIIKYIPVF